jgi:hypothetical protein
MTEEVAKAEKVEKVKKPKYEGPACSVCGKPLTDPESVKAGIGPLCRQKGWTKEKVAEKMATLKRDAVPEGWLKLADVDKQLRLKGIPVARMVRAIGGDRGMHDPISPEFQVIYVGRARYLAPFILTPEGLNILSDKYLGKPKPEAKPRAKKEKAPVAEGDAKPAKPAKKAVAPADKDLDSVWKDG